MEDYEPLNFKDKTFIFIISAIIGVVWFCAIFFGAKLIFS
jgi:hypothetical protein